MGATRFTDPPPTSLCLSTAPSQDHGPGPGPDFLPVSCCDIRGSARPTLSPSIPTASFLPEPGCCASSFLSFCHFCCPKVKCNKSLSVLRVTLLVAEKTKGSRKSKWEVLSPIPFIGNTRLPSRACHCPEAGSVSGCLSHCIHLSYPLAPPSTPPPPTMVG